MIRQRYAILINYNISMNQSVSILGYARIEL